MIKNESEPLNIENKLFKRPVQINDVWTEGNFVTLNSNEIGTPCLRYLVRQPDGHRDVDGLESGNYSFGAFGFRHEIGGELKQLKRQRSTLGNLPLVVYYPKSDEEPFGKDFFGAYDNLFILKRIFNSII